MRRKGTHFFCFLQISAVKNAEIWKMYLQCVQNTTPYQAKHRHRKIAPLRTKRSIIAARLHLSVPSGASSSQDCTTPYQAEHHHRKIVPLRTKRSIIIARLYHSVPSGAILLRAKLSRLLQSLPCLAAAPLRTKQNNHHRNIRYLSTKGPHQTMRTLFH